MYQGQVCLLATIVVRVAGEMSILSQLFWRQQIKGDLQLTYVLTYGSSR